MVQSFRKKYAYLFSDEFVEHVGFWLIIHLLIENYQSAIDSVIDRLVGWYIHDSVGPINYFATCLILFWYRPPNTCVHRAGKMMLKLKLELNSTDVFSLTSKSH